MKNCAKIFLLFCIFAGTLFVDGQRALTMTEVTSKLEELENMITHCPLGMKSGAIKDSQITASSYRNKHSKPQRARLDLALDESGPIVKTGGWRMATSRIEARGWIQIDLLTPQQITGVITQGRGPGDESDQYVETFEIFYGVENPVLMRGLTVRGSSENVVFQGNTDRFNKVTNMFPEPINARYLRLVVTSYHDVPILRMEILGC